MKKPYSNNCYNASSTPQPPEEEFDPIKEYNLYKSKLPLIVDPIHHDRTPACLLQCVNWVLDIEECDIVEDFNENRERIGLGTSIPNGLMDPKTTRKILTVVSKN